MNRLRYLTQLLMIPWLAIIGLSSCVAQNHEGNSDKPNIILIVADDMGYTDLGCYGGEINTPNLDQLASEGMRFTQFYNGAVCTETRATMLTGQYVRHGSSYLRENAVTIAEVLKEKGYSTILSGKWHLGFEDNKRPIDRGFDEFYGHMIGAISYFEPQVLCPPFISHWGPKEPFVHNEEVIRSVPDDYYSTDAFTDHAISRIKENVAKKKPFFLHLAFNAPHYPLHALPEDIAGYKGKYDEGYEIIRERRFKKAKELGVLDETWKLPQPDKKLGDFRYDYNVAPWNSLSQKEKEWQSSLMEVYAAMVDRLDQNIGRLMEALEENGVDENTLIIFYSDNGGCASMPKPENMDMYKAYHQGKVLGGKDTYAVCGPGWAYAQSSPFRRYKVWTYEGGISTPMITWWKGEIKPGTSGEIAHIVDILPTCIDVSGAKYPENYNGHEILPLDGESMVPLMKGQSANADREMGWYLYGNGAYRKGKWKIVRGVTGKKWELYNMENDRTEMNDLASQYPAIFSELKISWDKWAEKCEVPLENE